MEETVIDPRELRIGNIMSYKGKIVWVTHLSLDIDDEYQDLIGFVELGKSTDEHMDWNRTLNLDLKRIPLTPEWLERCAFIHDDGDKKWYKSGSHVGPIYFIYQATYGLQGLGTHPGNNIKYLHQLQNLYFALTGTELEIKPL